MLLCIMSGLTLVIGFLLILVMASVIPVKGKMGPSGAAGAAGSDGAAGGAGKDGKDGDPSFSFGTFAFNNYNTTGADGLSLVTLTPTIGTLSFYVNLNRQLNDERMIVGYIGPTSATAMSSRIQMQGYIEKYPVLYQIDVDGTLYVTNEGVAIPDGSGFGETLIWRVKTV